MTTPSRTGTSRVSRRAFRYTLEFGDEHVHHLLFFLPVNEDLGSVCCNAPFPRALRSQHLDPMDFHGVVGIHDKNVAKGSPKELLLILGSGVLMQGNEVVKYPNDRLQQSGTELLYDAIQLEPGKQG